jgi:AcrR family transcriptional regulator
MADLARDLGISTKTLYRVFPSKADLVRELVETWAARLERQLRDEDDAVGPFADQLLHSSELWQANRRRYGEGFWAELERDYPESYALVTRARHGLRQRMLERIEPRLRPGIDAGLALELFDAGMARAVDPQVQRRYGVDARTAIRTAVRMWADGALAEPLPARRARTRANTP